ncbi:YqaA family protein [Ralstonia solanacearum]|uniref:DedA family protein n=1 Tax=Ralstonia solanacearum TaxID=305 RepID=A0AAE3NKU0_RALSL|nr:YqaA family protein [Ralstonia solanacearum]KFX27746.1 membrane protein [Ralstonia solanacearum]MBB6583252.1 DedA family protein [Ralstonia solanacearum]MDB0523368.1 DedA family protein [Ralstonia solanacearum]
METWIDWFLATLALPNVGLPAIFIVCFVSATLLPLGSEPAVFGYIKLNPDMFWPAILVATAGNTLGGAVDWWIGYAAKLALVRFHLARRRRQHDTEHLRHIRHPRRHRAPPLDKKYFRWMRRIGPVSLLASWVPGIGDPLCTLAGWLRLSFLPSVAYMAIGKFLRYLVMTTALLTLPDRFWHGIFGWIKNLLM